MARPRSSTAAADSAVGIAVDAAVARVLDAERAAAASIEAARRAAAKSAEQARADARQIQSRAHVRVARVHALVETRLRDALDAIQSEMQALPQHDEPDAADRQRLERAVGQLAAALTRDAGASP
jgi:hypothetical protein